MSRKPDPDRLLDWLVSELLKVSKFGAIGVAATLVHLLIFSLLMEHNLLGSFFSTLTAFLVAFLVTLVGNVYWTFHRTRIEPTNTLRLALVSLLGFGINALLAVVIVDYCSLPYPVATLSMALTALLSYVLTRAWVFPGSSTGNYRS